MLTENSISCSLFFFLQLSFLEYSDKNAKYGLSFCVTQKKKLTLHSK